VTRGHRGRPAGHSAEAVGLCTHKQHEHIGLTRWAGSAIAPGDTLAVFHQSIGANGQLWWNPFDGTARADDVEITKFGFSAGPLAPDLFRRKFASNDPIEMLEHVAKIGGFAGVRRIVAPLAF